MVKLGFFMTISLLFSTASMYWVRSFVVHQNGLDTVGYFIAAWTISSLYISAIFNAMGADYFPRLSSAQSDVIALKKIVNDQTEIALLLTLPIIIMMISFIDWLVPLFYSKAFNITASILSWQLAGDFFKVLSWPLGFVLLAKGKGMMFLTSEIIWNLIFCSLIYFGWHQKGIEITGIGFLIAYLMYTVIVYVMVRRLVKFKWSKSVWKITGVLLPLLIVSFLNVKFLTGGSRYLLGSFFTLTSSFYSYKQLQNLIDFKRILNRVRLKNVV
jgi:PST family polysaccharide transporter